MRSFRRYLESKSNVFNRPSFIESDPVFIPHLFNKKQDIEISGFFAAVFAWGNRKTIINKSLLLMDLMDKEPYAFCMHHKSSERKRFETFRHRTFNEIDLFYFLDFFRYHYSRHHSLETAFSSWIKPGDDSVENALNGFYDYFFSLPDVPFRTRKHVPSPASGSTCKRLNMFLRWMVRNDNRGVDFGLWKKIKPSQLVCPVDLHVARVSRQLGLLQRKQTDWTAALELTAKLKELDPDDPVKFDFALFGMGVTEKIR